ncbi:MAG TPA: thioredoxin [Candidatus Aminicenantes bacterium]|nr:thioredoxin [Candidatus Aminicenantes bacterium]
MSEIITANDGNFESSIQGSPTVIVDFWAPTCMPCRLMEPGLEKIAASHPEKVRVVKVNVNESPKTSSRFFVRSLPTLLFIKDGQVKTQIVGAVNPVQIEKALSEVG